MNIMMIFPLFFFLAWQRVIGGQRMSHSDPRGDDEEVSRVLGMDQILFHKLNYRDMQKDYLAVSLVVGAFVLGGYVLAGVIAPIWGGVSGAGLAGAAMVVK